MIIGAWEPKSMLTLKQALAIKTKSVRPPWHASQLVSSSTAKQSSLRSLINDVGNQRVLIFVQVRDLAILNKYKTAEDLSKAWAGLVPNTPSFQASLKIVSQNLPHGASIVYVSTDGQTVAISGTLNALSSVAGAVLTQDQVDQRTKGLEDIAQGLGIVSAADVALVAAAGATGTVEIFIVIGAGLAFAAAGLMLGVGIAALAAFCASVSTTATAPDGSQDVPVVGTAPSGGQFSVTAAINDLELQLAYSEMVDIPDPGTLPGAGDLVPGAPAGLDGGTPGDGDGDVDGGEASA